MQTEQHKNNVKLDKNEPLSSVINKYI